MLAPHPVYVSHVAHGLADGVAILGFLGDDKVPLITLHGPVVITLGPVDIADLAQHPACGRAVARSLVKGQRLFQQAEGLGVPALLEQHPGQLGAGIGQKAAVGVNLGQRQAAAVDGLGLVPLADDVKHLGLALQQLVGIE
jgi:hypothetical protein